MSVQTLYTAATGMQALETKLDVIANNLANVNTTGFKRGRANFEDLFYRHQVMPGAEDDGGGRTATGIPSAWARASRASRPTSSRAPSSKPTMRWTSPSKAPASSRCVTPTGDTLYTRAGNFSINAEGNLVLGSASMGRLLEPPITIPAGRQRHLHQPERQGARPTAGQHRPCRSRADQDGRLHQPRRPAEDKAKTCSRRPTLRERPRPAIPATPAWARSSRTLSKPPTWSRSRN